MANYSDACGVLCLLLTIFNFIDSSK